mgnify:FL=1
MSRLKLHGFNNLTKTLSFNIYDICYAATPSHRREYLEYIDEEYNAERLTRILNSVAEIIGAQVLDIARQDYEPQGASVTMMIAEGQDGVAGESGWDKTGLLSESVVAHLDKSHITVHTYPESHPEDGISTFRADIDVSTCGQVSPLNALNFLIHSFESDVVILDYRVRGFTRDVKGSKYFIDHQISSIQDYLADDVREQYRMRDINVYEENIFHTKMMLRGFDLDDYLFGLGKEALAAGEQQVIVNRLHHEMLEMFYGRII